MGERDLLSLQLSRFKRLTFERGALIKNDEKEMIKSNFHELKKGKKEGNCVDYFFFFFILYGREEVAIN